MVGGSHGSISLVVLVAGRMLARGSTSAPGVPGGLDNIVALPTHWHLLWIGVCPVESNADDARPDPGPTMTRRG